MIAFNLCIPYETIKCRSVYYRIWPFYQRPYFGKCSTKVRRPKFLILNNKIITIIFLVSFRFGALVITFVFGGGEAADISLHLLSSFVNTVVELIRKCYFGVGEFKHLLMDIVDTFEHLSYLGFEFWVLFLLVLDNFLKNRLSFGVDIELKLQHFFILFADGVQNLVNFRWDLVQFLKIVINRLATHACVYIMYKCLNLINNYLQLCFHHINFFLFSYILGFWGIRINLTTFTH